MLMSTGLGWGAEAAGLGCLLTAAGARRTWSRRHLTLAGAALCLLVAPGSCAGGFLNDRCKDPAGDCGGALP